MAADPLQAEEKEGRKTPIHAVDSARNDEPPDAGLVAWSQTVPAHIANMLSWGYGSGFAVFQLYYKQAMNLPTAQISWIGSVQLFLYFILAMVSGRLADAGYIRVLYGTGSVLVVLGIFMTSLAAEYWQVLLAQGFCNGIGGGLMFMPAVANVGTYFKRKRTFAMSVNACGSSTGAILFPAIVQYLTPKIGFAWAVRVCGFVALFLGIVGFVLLRPRKLRRTPGPMVDWSAFRNVSWVVFTSGSFLIYFSLFTMLIYVNSYARESVGLSDIESINFVLITHAVSIPSRPLFGFLADRYIGAVNTWGFNATALGALAFGWIGVRSRADMCVVMGFVNGAAQGVFPGAGATLVTDVTRLGTWVGMIFAACGLGTLAGPPVMGAIIDASGGDYMWAQLWAGLMIIAGAMLVLTISPTTRRYWAKAHAT
ncbi:major facilitator superfamily domain-containing protein [Xylariomycetidae sp. FL2044]|nr:major facilitator superfamily domain-containing protein [Xylariomycetidae sp. FL2044]